MNRLKLVFFCLMLAVVAVYFAFKSGTQVTVVNRASEPIATATVVVAEQTLTFSNLEPAASRSQSYRTDSKTQDSDLEITVTMKSGKTLKESGGYVTHGASVHHEVSVEDTRIVIKELDSGANY